MSFSKCRGKQPEPHSDDITSPEESGAPFTCENGPRQPLVDASKVNVLD